MQRTITQKTRDRKFGKFKRAIEKAGAEIISAPLKRLDERWRLRCRRGHALSVKAKQLENGFYCQRCWKEEMREKIAEIAESQGWKCLNKRWKPIRERWSFVCKKGHKLKKQGKVVLAGRLDCRACELEESLQIAKDIAKKNGFVCLERKGRRRGQGDEWRFRCSSGHAITRLWNGFSDGSMTCEQCEQENSLKKVRDVAESHGGRCLENNWKPGWEIYTFECANEHRFEKPGAEVLRGNFHCSQCKHDENLKAAISAGKEIGWKCLEKKGKNKHDKTDWLFECTNGHENKRSWSSIVSGGMVCHTCVAEETASNITSAAHFVGLEVVETEAKTTTDVWIFVCRNGHTIEHRGAYFLKEPNANCRECQKEQMIDDLRQKAEYRGGRLVSETLENNKSIVEFVCEVGHEFKITAYYVLYHDSWCNVCSGHAEGVMLEKVRAIAKEKGGRCLSKEYKNYPEKMRFECKKGHRWSTFATNVVHQGHWCQTCYKAPSEEIIRKVEETVKSKGGTMLFRTVKKLSQKERFKCAKGHTFEASPTHIVKKGYWCPTCADEERFEQRRLGIKAAREAARARGGRCLTEQYESGQKMARWRCGKGHEWDARFTAVIHQNNWCPECWHETQRLGLETAQAIAKERGGECLAKEYKNGNDYAWWRCEMGHEWQTRFKNVLSQGSWCPECGRDRSHLVGADRADARPLGIEDCHGIADRHNGLCLMGYYVNYEYPMAWRCERGHEFTSSLRGMEERKNFCVECADLDWRQERIQGVHEWAGQFGGRCLTVEWDDAMTKMQWECERGHQFEASLHNMEGRENFCHECLTEDEKAKWLENANAHAKSKGGKCLADKWMTAQTKMLWECNKGHQFNKSWNNAIVDPFCGICAKEEKLQRDGAARLNALAEKHGGRWIESEYKGIREKYEFECENGHRFLATPDAAGRSWQRKCSC